MHFFLSGR